MSPTRIRTLAVLAALAALVGYLLLDALEGSGGAPVPVPWPAAAGLFGIAAVVLVAGREVRRSVAGRRERRLDPLLAARIAVLAQAARYVGAVLTGWYAAQALVVLPDLVGDRRLRFWVALVAVAGAIAVVVAGILAQRWCRRPPDETDEPPPRDDERPAGGVG